MKLQIKRGDLMKTRTKTLCSHVLILSVVFMGFSWLAPFSHAQENIEFTLPQPYVQFSFAPPGARAMAMGAAFIGLADDATAAESNPAGLTILIKPEISAHFRSSSYSTEFPNFVTNTGTSTFKSSVFSPSYFSIVIPAKPFAFSLYYHQSANFKTNPEFSTIVNLQGLDFNHTSGWKYEELISNFGVSTAVQLGKYVSVGGSLRITRTKLFFNYFDRVVSVDFGPNFMGEAGIKNDESQSKVTFNFGVLINPAGTFSLGFVYKKGGDFVFKNAKYTETFRFFGLEDTNRVPFKSKLAVPDVFGIGAALRPTDTLVFALDIVRVNYSDLSIPESNVQIEDGTEFHLGGEYTFFLGNTPFSIRAGFFTDPDHDMWGDAIDTSQVHYTFGGGIVIQQNFQLDFAFNLSKTVKEFLISSVFRFS